MSVIWGLFYRNGKPVADEPAAMYSGMRHFPHESHAFAACGNCGFGQLLTYNTPEAVYESMPKRLDAEHLLFVAEGRIDNRNELFDALGIAVRAETPDGDLMLAAYRKWGENCTGRLVGKWSFAAFHTDTQRLFVARDKWDYTNITYYLDENVFAFSTSEKGLFPLPFIAREIDELTIAGLLIVWSGDYRRTAYKGIRRLLPSHTLSITRERVQERRYWNFTDIQVRRGLKLEDYTEALLETLNQAVSARLRSYKPVAAMLSGGLDSSTVCLLAAEQMAKGNGRLRSYSHVPQFLPPDLTSEGRFGDERPYIEAIVAAAGNIDPVYLDSAGLSPLAGIREGIRLYGEPFHGAGNAYWMVDIFTSAQRDGFGTVLTGEFGNSTTSWAGSDNSLSTGELLRRHGALGVIKKKLVKPLLFGCEPLARVYKQLAYGQRTWEQLNYCAEPFEASLQLRKRIRNSDFDTTFHPYRKSPLLLRAYALDVNVARLPLGASIGCETGLELRDPTGDSRVIECALSIPDEMFAGPKNRWVLRRMMEGRLPDKVRLNTHKGLQIADVQARLKAHAAEMERVLADMEAAGFDRIADMPKIRADWNALNADPANVSFITAANFLRPIAAFEFYRTL